MTIQEILEAHRVIQAPTPKNFLGCACGMDFFSAIRSDEEFHREHVARVLEQHVQEREADAVRETARYIERLYPRKGLINRADLLADIEIAAGRLGRGIHANGREKESSDGR